VSQVRVNYRLIDAKALLVPTPSYVDTGIVKGSSALETVTITNKGILPANDLTVTLLAVDNTPAPNWAQLSTPAELGSIDVGQSRNVDISFTPPTSLADGIYEMKLRVEGPNFPAQHLNVFAAVTQSGIGGIFFKAADIFTATLDRNSRLIPGLADAQITVENEDVPSIRQIRNTDEFGEALFEGLPAGRYKYRATARNHQEVGGRLSVRPGVVANESVFLQYNTVTVEWSVREITIQDRYDIVLSATFETDVPAAVVMIQPVGVNLPKMNPGEIFYGELTLQNFGLIRAEDVEATLPADDGFFRYEFLASPPTSLEAKQRVTIPYRVTALKALDGSDTNGTASGGGCYSYSNQYRVKCQFICANGARSVCGASASWFSVSNSSCGGGAGGGVGGGGGGGGGAGGIWGGGGASTGLRTKGKKCVFIPDGKGEGQCK
jgi:large repetitive protein